MNFKKVISIFVLAVSAISMSSVCCHAVDGSAHPEFVNCLGVSDDNCKSEDGKNNCDDKEDKENENEKEDKDEE